jgi:hypothetical protein
METMFIGEISRRFGLNPKTIRYFCPLIEGAGEKTLDSPPGWKA